VIVFDQVTVTYDGQGEPVLRRVDVRVAEGELCLVVGPTGVGKSTLLGAVNGLVPHFTGGTLSGRVLVAGRDTATHRPRDLADVVGVVSQDPASGFTTDTVEEELAYAMEQLAVPAAVMRKRVEETLDLLSLADLRDCPLHELSGGQQQRVAIGSVLTAGPSVLVLDEPTSALDPTAAEEVLAALTRLVHDLGMTVLLAEHRLERVVQYADSVLEVRCDGTVRHGSPQSVLSDASVAPPIVELGRMVGWTPVALSVRDARRLAPPLRARVASQPTEPAHRRSAVSPAQALRARRVLVRYGDLVAVNEVDLQLHAGEVTALMGRNGCGKSSLLWALQGSGPRQGGSVDVAGLDPHTLSRSAARRLVGLVPQTPGDLLYHDTVAAELAEADRDGDAPEQSGGGSAEQILDRLAPGIDRGVHPRDLSEGQRLALALAVQLRAAPAVVLLDEPTRGLDYHAKAALGHVLDTLAAAGHAVLISTHDVEFAASSVDRVVVMADGDVVADGGTEQILASSPAFAPQVAKVLAPLPYLTVGQLKGQLRC